MVPLSGRGGACLDDDQHLDDVRVVFHVRKGFDLDSLCIWNRLDDPFVWKGEILSKRKPASG